MSELNLIPSHIKLNRHKRYMYKQYVAVGVIILSLLFFGLYFPWMQINNLKTSEEELRNRVSSQQYLIAQGQSIKNEINDYEIYVDKVNAITQNRTLVNDKIRGIEKYMPSDLAFKRLDYNGGIINVNGEANRYEAVAEFVANLQENSIYSSSRIVSITYDVSKQDYNFNVSIK